jgi:hypothetical protein
LIDYHPRPNLFFILLKLRFPEIFRVRLWYLYFKFYIRLETKSVA